MAIGGERDLRQEKKLGDILAAARRRFAAQGYAGAGMEGVARDARVSTATLYQAFPSKAVLFQAVVTASLEEFAEELRRLTAAEGPAEARLRAFAVGYARFLQDPFARSLFRLIVAERSHFQEAAEQFYAAAQARFGARVMALLAELQAEGRVHAPSPARAAGQLLGMIEHPCLVRPLLAGDDSGCRRTPETVAEDALETFLARYAMRSARALEPA